MRFLTFPRRLTCLLDRNYTFILGYYCALPLLSAVQSGHSCSFLTNPGTTLFSGRNILGFHLGSKQGSWRHLGFTFVTFLTHNPE